MLVQTNYSTGNEQLKSDLVTTNYLDLFTVTE